jgi:hypothetical protein
MVQCWAADAGTGLDIVISSSGIKPTPWHDVTLTIRAGSTFSSCKKTALFQSGRTAHLNWASFPDWRRHRSIAVWLEIDANDAQGSPVRGVCLVEDRIQLTAEPEQRKALRGASALLDPEATPDMADVSAIFRLAERLFDGTLIKIKTSGNEKPSPAPEKETEVSVALWPPEEHTHELEHRIGQTATGQLKFFQRIFAKLLNGGTTTGTPPVNNPTGSVDEDDEDNQSEEAENKRVKEEERARDRAERMWNEAQHNFERLYDRLMEFLVTSENAKDVWPAAIYSFLAVLATMNGAKRLMPELKISLLTKNYCDNFLKLMTKERTQDPDFCAPKNYRYRGRKFPALADDLLKHFKTRVHPDLALLPLALVIDQKMREKEDLFPYRWGQYVNQLFDESFIPDAGAHEACRRIWRTYIRDGNETDANFVTTFNEVFANRQNKGTA